MAAFLVRKMGTWGIDGSSDGRERPRQALEVTGAKVVGGVEEVAGGEDRLEHVGHLRGDGREHQLNDDEAVDPRWRIEAARLDRWLVIGVLDRW